MKCFIIILLLCPLFSVGQVNVDSLWNVWEDAAQTNSTRLDALYKISKKGYLYSQPDSAFYYAQIEYDFAKSKGLKKEMSRALNTIGVSYSIRGNYTTAMDYHKRSLKVGKEIEDQYRIAISLRDIGIVYLQQSDYDKAMNYYDQSLAVSKKLGNKKLIASTLNNIGLIYMDLKDYSKSLVFLEQSLSNYRAIKSPKGILKLLNNIGTIHRFQGNDTTALDYYKQSLSLMNPINSHYSIAICLNNIGLSNNNLGNKKKAMHYFLRSLELNKKIGNKKGLARSLISIGNIYREMKKDSVIELGTQALTIAQGIGSNEEIADAAELLYKTFKTKGKEKQALTMHELYILTRDTILSEDNRRAIISQAIKHEYEKKALAKEGEHEKQRSIEKLKLQKEKYSIIGGFIFLIFIAGMVLRIEYIKRLNERDILLREIELLKEKSLTKMVAAPSLLETKEVALDKEKIEKSINGKLNQTDWKILNTIFKNPSITNKEIAAEISRSYEGTGSSLRKMYKLFDLKTSRNNKMTLILEATRISNELPKNLDKPNPIY